MAKVNKHELKMVGLKSTSGSTENFTTRSGLYNEIFYNMKSGEVWTVLQCSIGQTAWTAYQDEDIVKICNTVKHMTMQEIADSIYNYVREYERR